MKNFLKNNLYRIGILFVFLSFPILYTDWFDLTELKAYKVARLLDSFAIVCFLYSRSLNRK